MAHGKRSRQQAEAAAGVSLLDLDSGDMARILMLFSGHHPHHIEHAASSSPERVFECKTCSRQFPSFQALGGHRASHKKPRLADGAQAEPAKPKVHGCSVCGLEFSVGQALGGHMRRHRAVVADSGLGLGLGLGPEGDDGKKTTHAAELVLDLNVPALEEEPAAAADRARPGLAAELFPVVVDFRR